MYITYLLQYYIVLLLNELDQQVVTAASSMFMISYIVKTILPDQCQIAHACGEHIRQLFFFDPNKVQVLFLVVFLYSFNVFKPCRSLASARLVY